MDSDAAAKAGHAERAAEHVSTNIEKGASFKQRSLGGLHKGGAPSVPLHPLARDPAAAASGTANKPMEIDT